MINNNIFKLALEFVLKAEGGYVDNPDDKGGSTNYGITQNTYNVYLHNNKEVIQTVKGITMSEVQDIYFHQYWLAAECNSITSTMLAMVMFDTAVNMGVGRALTFLKLSNNNVNDYLNLRIAKYKEFANVPGQQQFLQGWLNRINDLKKYVGLIK